MPQIVEAFGQRIEFPDGMPPAEIEAAMKRNAMTLSANQPREAEKPVSAAASRMAAEGMGPLDSLAVAAGQGFDKAAMGLRELTLKGVRSFAPQSFADAADRELRMQAEQEAVKDSAYAGLRQSRPFLTGVGESVPTMMATGGMGVVPAAMTFAGMDALKPGTAKERVQRGAVSGGSALAGGWFGNKVAGALAPVPSKMAGESQREALKVAQNVGYKPRLSEVTGSPFLSRLEDMAARTPGGAGIMDDFARANQVAINRRAAQSIGESADELTPQVFAQANSRIGGVFEAIKSLPGKPISITPPVGRAADEVLRVTSKMIAADRDPQLVALANQAKTLAKNMGKVDGETYQLIRSGLSNQSFEATGTNKALYGQLLKALDDAAEESLKRTGNAKLAEAFKSARLQYGNLKTLEKGATAKGGNVSPSLVASSMRTNNPGAFREGRMAGNPLYDVAVLGERLKPLTAGSPTYERELAGDLLGMLVRTPYAYGAAKLTTGSVPRAYAGLLAANPTANLLSQPIAQSANPAGGAIGSYLGQRLLLPSVPMFSE